MQINERTQTSLNLAKEADKDRRRTLVFFVIIQIMVFRDNAPRAALC